MPTTIALVGVGRCCPSPDRVPEGASPDRDARRIVPGRCASWGGQRFLPVLRALPGGVSRIDRNDRHSLLGGHRDKAGLEPGGGEEGQKLTVTTVNHLATQNQTLKITGSGYDEEKGICVALCVDNGEGELPTPCIGGVDTSGESHSSAWISSNPPDYGEQLAVPYDEGGSFEVELPGTPRTSSPTVSRPPACSPPSPTTPCPATARRT